MLGRGLILQLFQPRQSPPPATNQAWMEQQMLAAGTGGTGHVSITRKHRAPHPIFRTCPFISAPPGQLSRPPSQATATSLARPRGEVRTRMFGAVKLPCAMP